MVAAHEETRHATAELADGLLSLFGHESPDTPTIGAAMTLAEFIQRVNHFLTRS